jgi:hypothetical protein
MEFQLWEVRTQKMFSIQQVERRKNDLMFQLCITKHMEHLDQESRSTETMSGQFLKINIDLAMQRRNCLRVLVSLYTQRELMVLSPKLLLLEKQLRISKL